MRNVTVTFADNSQHVYNGVPDDVTPDAIETRAANDYHQKVTGIDGGASPSGPDFHPSMPDGVSGAPGLLGGLQAAGQLALSGATHAISGPIVEGLAGLAARATGNDPEAAKAAAEKYAVYNTPENSVARSYTDAMTHAVAPVVAPIANALSGDVHTADDFIGKYGGPEAQRIARQTAGTAGDLLNAAPILGAAGKGVAALAAAAKPVEEAATVARLPHELAQAADIRVPPSIMAATTGAEKPGIAARAGESLGGSSEMSREDIIHNKGRVNALGAQAANLPDDTLLSRAKLDEADAPHAAVYRQVEAAIPEPIPIDDTAKAAIARAGERPNSLRPIPATVDKAREGALAIDQADGTQLKATIADYRTKGYEALKSDDPDTISFGKSQLDIANALEDQMERQLDTTNPGLADQFRQAREGFAINNTIREGLVGHDLDPKFVLKAADTNRGIQGPLKLIADLTERFPQVMTTKVPKITAGSIISRGVHYGVPGLLGYAVGGPVGAAAGVAAAPLLQKGLRGLMDVARSGVSNPRVALGTALADYAKQRGGAFAPAQTGFAVPGKRGGAVATVPGQNYAPPVSATRLANQGLNPGDQALADAVAARHPAAARERTPMLALPAPRASISEVAARVTRQHPSNPAVSSTVTQAAQRAKVEHMIQVLAARHMAGG